MKQPLLFLVGIFLLVASCKKGIIAEFPKPVVAPPVKTILDVPGSYLVYNWYRIDDQGNETLQSEVDSLIILGDSVINGNTYIYYRSNYMGGPYSNSFMRDSSGFIIDETGQELYRYKGLNQPYEHVSETNWYYYSLSVNNDTYVTVPSGTYNCLERQIHYYSPSGAAITGCGDNSFILRSYYELGTGLISQRVGFTSEIQNDCVFREKRLVEFYKP